ncbi:MAG: hypothetical protein AUJ47_07270 [Candidatus Marinimicrobia bacterium CG1_02_48_14]|nr:MAG: hypothetical protein AUJ47_07270 [Candidatus Marinimicrobia bacterium CG1_02_48_14]
MQYLQHIGIVCLFTVWLVGCASPQKPAAGEDDVIIVIAEENNWNITQNYLNETFGKPIYTPQEEYLYTLKWVDPSQFETFRMYKNVILISQFEVSSSLTGLLKSMVSDSALTRIRNTPGAYYSRRNAYADGQELMIVVGKSDGDVQSRIRLNETEMLAKMESQTAKRLTSFIYRIGEQTKLAEGYFQQYGWYMRLMHDYLELKNDPSQQFVWLGRDYPYRWIVINSIPAPDSFDLPSVGKQMLEDVYGKLIPEVALSMTYFTMQESWINNHAALEFRGLWEHKTEIQGGPFIAYSFYAPEQDKIFLLTGIVWAPDRQKLPYIRQIEMMLRTFSFTEPAE